MKTPLYVVARVILDEMIAQGIDVYNTTLVWKIIERYETDGDFQRYLFHKVVEEFERKKLNNGIIELQ